MRDYMDGKRMASHAKAIKKLGRPVGSFKKNPMDAVRLTFSVSKQTADAIQSKASLDGYTMSTYLKIKVTELING